MSDMPKTVAQLEAEIAQLKKENDELKKQVMYDPLTNLYTRRFMDDRAIALVNDAERFSYTNLFVLFIDLDYFKQVNDTYGHEAGDAVLKDVAKVIKETLRLNDIAGRWGGDEIVVFGRGNAAVVAERIRHKVETTLINGIKMTVSIGAAMYVSGNDLLPHTLARADNALYKAKHAGRNRVCVYHEL